MNPLFQAGLELQLFIQQRCWPFCFIGGLSVIRWGEARMTQDIDLSVFSGFGSEESFVDALLDSFASRIPDAKKFALNNRVLLLAASNGVAVDVSLGGLPFEEQMAKRASPYEFAHDCSLITCSAEDLIIIKAFAERPQDWIDVEGIIMRHGPKLDAPYILGQLTPLCDIKEAPEIIPRLQDLIRKNS